MGYSIHIDRSADIEVQARIKINVEPPVAPGPFVKLTATCERFSSTHTGATAMAYTLPADKQVQLKISYLDANGNPATVDDAGVTWDSSDEDIASCQPTTGEEVSLIPGTKIGNCQISAKADADLGEGVRELVTLLDVIVVGGEAVTGTIEPVGEPVPKP
jgi:hypothetical protein